MIGGYYFAILSGASDGIQGVFQYSVTKQTSIWTAATFVQFSAFLVSIFRMVFGWKTGIVSKPLSY